MSRKRLVTFDQLCVEIQAQNDLTPADRREVLLLCRAIRKEAEDIITKSIPEHMKKHINIKVT